MTVRQYRRKATLVVRTGGQGLDLSELHFTFQTAQQDVESPNNCSIRVYNLDPDIAAQVRKEFEIVTLQAGYDEGFGVIFQGNIKQFRVGRENPTDSYLDILAADGDLGYNFSVVRQTLAANSTPEQRVKAMVDAMSPNGITSGYTMPFTGGVLPRGKVLFGLAKVAMRQEVQSQNGTWHIDKGKLNILPLDGYKPGEAVVLNAFTGLIGRPEQTEEGLRCRCLLNPRLEVGNLVQIDNKSVNQLLQQNPNAAPIPFNQYTGIQNLASITTDGLYRIYVVEHVGDTRGQEWYSDLVLLAVNPSTQKVVPYG